MTQYLSACITQCVLQFGIMSFPCDSQLCRLRTLFSAVYTWPEARFTDYEKPVATLQSDMLSICPYFGFKSKQSPGTRPQHSSLSLSLLVSHLQTSSTLSTAPLQWCAGPLCAGCCVCSFAAASCPRWWTETRTHKTHVSHTNAHRIASWILKSDIRLEF